MSEKKMGTLYVLSNPCFSYLKIGYTTNNVVDRCRQLSNMQAIPLPFEIAYTAFVENPRDVEGIVHRYFKSKRVGKEFFAVELEEVKRLVEKLFNVIDENKFWLDKMDEGLARAGM